jgi:DNA transposition AAA+ family ATPase
MLPLDNNHDPDSKSLTASLATRHDLTPARVRDAYADKLASGDVTEEQLSDVLWLLGHGKAHRLSIGALARASEIDEGTLSKLFRGAYEAKIDKIATRIAGFRELTEQRAAINRADFVETSLVRTLWQVCDTALLFQTIIPVYGDSQTGKTTALEQKAKRDRYGRTIYVRMPDSGQLTEFLVELNAALMESTRTNGHLLKRRPLEVITASTLLIIDEIHQTTLVPGKGSARVGTLEYIRRLWDATKCGLILCGTNAFRDEVESGRHKAMLEQLRRRGLPPVQLPAVLPRADMDAIAAAYGLPAADDATHELRERLVKTSGLRAYTNFLKSGAKLAERAKAKIAWAHFTSAHDIFARLSARDGKGGK